MKVIIANEQLIQRDESTEMVEALLSWKYETELLTMVHKHGSILGRINTVKITSSFLSFFIGSFFKTKDSFFKKFNFVKAVARFFKVPKADAYVVISSGIIDALKLPSDAKRIIYFYKNPENIKLPILKDYTICFASNAIKDSYNYQGDCEIIPPAFESRNYPKKADLSNNKQIIIKTGDLSFLILQRISQEFKDYKIIIMSDQLYNNFDLKSKFKEFNFIPLLGSSGLYIKLLETSLFVDTTDSIDFPYAGFSALCTGVCTLVYSSLVNQEFFIEDIVSFYEKNLIDQMKDSLSNISSFNSDLARRYALRFNERVFKNKMIKHLR